MGPQRRNDDTTVPSDAGAPTAWAPKLTAHPAAGLHIVARDAFRDKAEREARKRAEQLARRMVEKKAGATPAAAEPVVAKPEPSSPAKVEYVATPPAPLRIARAASFNPGSNSGQASASIIPWPGHRRVIASMDAPLVERPPPINAPKVDAPKTDPKPASPGAPKPDAPFSAAEFWGNKKKKGGGGGSNGGGGSGGSSDVARKTWPFDQDDAAGAVIVLLILLLIGWMALNLGGKPSNQDRVLQVQSTQNTPAPPPPTVKPDPFPAGPIDLKPKSPMPEVEAARVTPAPAPATSEPVVTTQVAPSPPSPVAQQVRATCAPGRMIHAYFCTSRSDLTPAARSALDADLKQWRECFADQELVVKGYADTRGSQELNAALGENRAKQLADILRSQGLKVSAVVGVGKLEGLDEGQNCLNQRRVDIGLKSEIDAATPSKACAPPKTAAPILCGSVAPKSAAAATSPAR